MLIMLILLTVVIIGGSSLTMVNNSDINIGFNHLFKKYGTIYNVNWKWLKAIALNESLLGKYSTNSSDGKSLGLMHVTRSTATRLLNRNVSDVELLNDDLSVKMAAMLIAENKRLFPDNTRYVIMGYNQSRTKLLRGVEIPITANEYYPRWLRWMEKIKDEV